MSRIAAAIILFATVASVAMCSRDGRPADDGLVLANAPPPALVSLRQGSPPLGPSRALEPSARKGEDRQPPLVIDYSALVDRDAVCHSQSAVGESLDQLAALTSGGGPQLTAARQAYEADVEPFLEPMGFVLDDAVVASTPRAQSDLTDVAELFPAGSPQPAWVDLVRSRYFGVLSDGSGFVRLYLPGPDAETAFATHREPLRPVLAWLVESLPVSASPRLSLEVHAYENDFSTQRFTLHRPAMRTSLSASDLFASARQQIDPDSLADYLGRQLTLEGVALDDVRGFVLLGSEAPEGQRPTVDGEPLSISDLAVAYRAVFFAGKGEPYISLDRGPFADSVNVNFGGRLADTRIGRVVLQSDMRFKTIATGFDPRDHDDIEVRTATMVPGFRSRETRFHAQPCDAVPSSEGTRFWFYPDAIALRQEEHGSLLRLVAARYLAGAERQEAWTQSGTPDSSQTPDWTSESISHLNENYPAYASAFPELRELDTVARLLAIFTWLKLKQEAGTLTIDLAPLLSVELPACTTPRAMPQMVTATAVDCDTNTIVRRVDASAVTERMARSRGRRPVDLAAESRNVISARERAADDQEWAKGFGPGEASEVLRLYTAARADTFTLTDALSWRRIQDEELITEGASEALGRELTFGEMLQLTGAWTSIGGGIDLDPTRIVRLAKPIGSVEGGALRGMISRPGAGVTFEGRIWIASPKLSGPGKLMTTRNPARHDLVGDLPGPRVSPAGFSHTSSTTPAGGDLSRSGGSTIWTPSASRTVRWNPGESNPSFIRVDRASGRRFDFESTGNMLRATVRSDVGRAEREIGAVRDALGGGSSIDDAWRLLPDDTVVKAVLRTPKNETYVLYQGTAREELARFVGPNRATTWTDTGVRARLERITAREIADRPTGTAAFAHARMSGDTLTLQMAKKRVTLDGETLAALSRDPAANVAGQLDDAINGSGNDAIVLVRDALSRRPERFGGSLKAGSLDDPVHIAATLSRRYPNKRFFIDDEMSIATSNLAAMPTIRGPQDLAVIVPETGFAVEDRGLMAQVGHALETAGMKPVSAASSAQTVLVISGHNDAALVAFLDDLGRQGALRNRVILLNTCHARANESLFSHLIQQYGARGIIVQPDRIRPVALSRVLNAMTELVNEAGASGTGIHPADLMRKSAERVLSGVGLSERLRGEVRKLLGTSLQISYVPRTRHLAA
ncbi:MAG: hypothetical protein ABL982_03985 [Vicinamibacterales bacterium]